jgi:hypothetical protein
VTESYLCNYGVKKFGFISHSISSLFSSGGNIIFLIVVAYKRKLEPYKYKERHSSLTCFEF